MTSKRKILLLVGVIASTGAVALTGCLSPSQQKATITTLSGLEVTVDAAYQGYLTSVVQGITPTNDVPKVSHAFNDFQAAMVLAAVAAGNNTNALASSALVDESAALINLITTVEKK